MHLCKFYLYYFTVFHHVAYIELTLFYYFPVTGLVRSDTAEGFVLYC